MTLSGQPSFKMEEGFLHAKKIWEEMVLLSLNTRIDSQVLEKIIYALEGLEFGTIQITVHDSQVTQIEKNEKHRFQLQKQKTKASGTNESQK